MAKNNNNKKASAGVPREVTDFIGLNFKGFWKKHKESYDKKKYAREDYHEDKLYQLPAVLSWYMRTYNNTSAEITEVKHGIYDILVDASFVDFLLDLFENKTPPENKFLLPIIYGDMLKVMHKNNAEIKASGSGEDLNDTSGIEKLVARVCKKRVKELMKAGVSESLARDCAMIVPSKKIFKSEGFLRPRIFSLTDVLYEHAKTEDIPVGQIFEILFGEDYYSYIITTGLLERKEKFGRLVGKQPEFYLAFSNWIFATIETMNADDIDRILKAYIAQRRRQDGQGKDGNRRFILTSLSADESPKLKRKVEQIIADNPSVEKYLG